MIEYEIKLDTIEKVKRFVSVIDKFENDIDIISGRYVINAHSIMAIFSLDLMNVLKVIIHNASLNDVAKFEKVMEEFRINEN